MTSTPSSLLFSLVTNTWAQSGLFCQLREVGVEGRQLILSLTTLMTSSRHLIYIRSDDPAPQSDDAAARWRHTEPSLNAAGQSYWRQHDSAALQPDNRPTPAGIDVLHKNTEIAMLYLNTNIDFISPGRALLRD